MSLTNIIAWLQDTSIAQFLEGSRYISMTIQIFHIVGFVALLAIVVALNVRVQKLAFRSQPVASFVNSLGRSYHISLVLALVAGVLLFLPRGVAYGANGPFDLKIVLLLAAIALQFALHWHISRQRDHEASALLRAGAAFTLVVWFAVGGAGRAIGFV